MNFQQIEYFFAVAETGNFTRASEMIYTTQPTLSRQIGLLEEELGYSLFDRSSKPLQMTMAGKVLYDGLKDSMRKIEYTKNSALLASQGKEGILNIAFQVGYYSEFMLLPILEDLKSINPNLKINSSKLTHREILFGLKNQSLDIAIGMNLPYLTDAGFQIIKIREIETLIVMSNQHRLKGKEKFSYDDFCGETFYLTSPNGYQVEDVLKDCFNLENVKQEKVENSEIAYFKVLFENGLTISNSYDPFLINNPNYHYKSLICDHKDSFVMARNENNSNPCIDYFIKSIKDYEKKKGIK